MPLGTRRPAPSSAPQGKPRLHDLYAVGETIGTGGFAVVKMGTEKATGQRVAIKVMAVPKGDSEDDRATREELHNELDILQGCHHTSIMKLKDYFWGTSNLYLVTELLEGGEVLEHVMSRGSYTEREARMAFRCLMEGIAYLHGIGVVHRDIKLENLLLGKPNDLSTLKIADFGLAKKMGEVDMQTVCGTPHYMAPEIVTPGKLSQAYGKAVDVWSCGIVLFCLMAGFFPFHDEDERRLYSKIRAGKVSFTHTSGISTEARHLIKVTLTVDPDARPSAAETLKHPFLLSKQNWPADLSLAQKFMKLTAKQRFRGGAKALIAIQKMNNLVHLHKKLHIAVHTAEDDEDHDVRLTHHDAHHAGYSPVGKKNSKRMNSL
mmetsp:Transcript_3798/g.13321  ORF Transcript_3798/g.13321 Transcript_3798/m.13321 type:complete len:376 (-) Transcript_3798:647-1774(-)